MVDNNLRPVHLRAEQAVSDWEQDTGYLLPTQARRSLVGYVAREIGYHAGTVREKLLQAAQKAYEELL